MGAMGLRGVVRGRAFRRTTVVDETAQRVVEAAQAAGDEASADLGIRRIQVHQKNAWMRRSHLER